RPRALEIFFADAPELGPLKSGHCRGGSRAAGARDPVADQLHDAELGGPFDQRVTGEKLRDQGRAGAMQADHEDRPLFQASDALAPLEELRGERRDRFVDLRRHADLLRLEALGANSVPRRIMLEALRVLAPILMRLAEREMDVKRIEV